MAVTWEAKLEAAIIALTRSVNDWRRELRRLRREQRELHDEEEDDA